MSLRHSARALIIDDTDAVLLCRFDFRSSRGGPVVWGSPGGGMDPGESELACLRRELVEEVGFELDREPAKVWRHVILEPGHAESFDGIVNHYSLVRTARFTPRGSWARAFPPPPSSWEPTTDGRLRSPPDDPTVDPGRLPGTTARADGDRRTTGRRG